MAIALFTVFTGTAFSAKTPYIRIKIGDSIKKVKVSGTDLKRYIWPKKSLRRFKGRQSIVFNCVSESKKLKINRALRLATINSATNLVSWNKSKYLGTLDILASPKMKGCDLVNRLSVEEYISTVLAKEMNTNWPIEALKAQAVAARSYALFKKQSKQVSKVKGYKAYYDLENSEKHQVSGSYFDATKKTRRASAETRGQVLAVKAGKYMPIFFHSKCGGRTFKPEQVWQNKVKGYSSVYCPFCHDHGNKKWTKSFKHKDVSKYITRALVKYENDYSLKNRSNIELLNDHKGYSKLRFYNKGQFKVLKKSRLRDVMGRRRLPSNYYHTTIKKDLLTFSGSGNGHGVGLCQFGAKELALKGYNYKQILAHYFPRLKLIKAY